ncbi:CLUMA_CG007698, isoform A [Clunio marinus]|uniref:CLUMA_CG007698, isoform A n=1 Tax=Clunio marinus TaxID=568069 RepID=A0A1J1I5I1_9DIPT|nr:CLUMA_CG007698, isoform A [Clunio marinus]
MEKRMSEKTNHMNFYIQNEFKTMLILIDLNTKRDFITAARKSSLDSQQFLSVPFLIDPIKNISPLNNETFTQKFQRPFKV